MTKAEIKSILKNHNCKIINESYYDDKENVTFTAYDGRGYIYNFFVDKNTGYATKQLLSAMGVLKPDRIDWFEHYKIITLCGSTKFKNEFMEVQKKLTLQGNIVISVGLFGHSGDDEVWDDGVKQMLDDMHKKKIDMADEIYVINKDGYIGESTKTEIEYAKRKGKSITYMEEPK